MKKKNIFFVLLICFINSSCNKEEQTDELQDKDFYSDVTTRASYISGTITGEMNPYVSDGYYTYDLSIPIQKQSVGIRISAVGGEARFKTNYQERFESYSINKDTGIKWTYDKNLFAEISQSASATTVVKVSV